MPKSRRLLPRWSPSSSKGSASANPGSNTTATRPKRRTVIAACNQCRRKKAKCDAERPSCTRCQHKELDCVYETDRAETHNRARCRKLAQLSGSSDFNGELVRILRTKDDRDAAAIHQRLKAGESTESIVGIIRDGDLLIQCALRPESRLQYQLPYMSTMPDFLLTAENPYLGSMLYNRTVNSGTNTNPKLGTLADQFYKMYDIPYRAAELIEPRIDRVKASEWTTITTSDELVRILLKTYFQFELAYHNFFHHDYFMEDLVAGRKRYCSSLLLNAVLSGACYGLLSLPRRSEFWNPQSLGYQFLAEAKRLWELERGEAYKITTIQAGAVLSICCNMNGADKVGNYYLYQSIAMAEDLGLFSQRFESQSPKLRAVYATTAWSLFSWQALHKFHFFEAPHLDRPPAIELPHDLGEIWVRYPHCSRPMALDHSLTVRAVFHFRALLNKISYRCFSRQGQQQGPLALDEAMVFRNDLTKWLQSLPAPFSAKFMVFPSHLKMHLHYHEAIITLFETLTTDSNVLGAENVAHVQEILKFSKMCMETVVRLYYIRHSFEHWDSFLIIYLTFVGFFTIKRLQSRTNDSRNALVSTVVLCSKGLHDQSRHCYLAEAFLTVLRDGSSADVQGMLADVDHGEERKRFVAGQIKSLYSVNIASVGDDRESKRLDRLVQACSGLDLSDDSASQMSS
ncbi:hypothetical protein CDD81_1217 [Ophiocordyceps australis]|uniref:Zn(2)-C6 fungal-type domain-containing protein n=1 Tax=Ophiocordyceps australis TaxID=1399860 RepID=A0A2C5XKP5_9HYPO|nr:hypothetical protein CDD81_1217 [Ophiocordyceps australis]